MDIIRKNPDKYTIKKETDHLYYLVKVLKEFDDDKKAIDALSSLVAGYVTEGDLLGSYEHELAEGKIGNRVNVLEAALEGIRESLVHAMGDGEQMERAAREAVKRINELVGG